MKVVCKSKRRYTRVYGYRNRNPHQDQRFFFFGAPFVGGLLGGLAGGLVGSALVRPGPYPYYPPYPPYPPYYQQFQGYPPYGGYGYGNPYN